MLMARDACYDVMMVGLDRVGIGRLCGSKIRRLGVMPWRSAVIFLRSF